MTGLVRADTELMLLAAQEMQRTSGIILEQFSSARQAMESLQSSRWSGRHRELMEERWLVLVAQFEPTSTKLDDIALRLRRTAEALDGAALTFADGAAGGSSFLSDLGAVLKSLPLPVLLGWGLNPSNPVPVLQTLLATPQGRALLDAAKDIYDPSLNVPITAMPDNGKDPVYVLVNGIGSDAENGQPEQSMLDMKAQLIANGVAEDHIITPGAVYNTNYVTDLHGTKFSGTDINLPTTSGTKLGGWWSPVDYLSSGGAWVANGITTAVAGEINSKTKEVTDRINTFTAGTAAAVNTVTTIGNVAIGVAQTQNEYVLGENGPYTQQVLKDTVSQINGNPLLKGSPVELIGHSGGGAIVANLPRLLENEGIPVSEISTVGSPAANYDFAKQYGHITAYRDKNDYIGLPLFRSSEGRIAIPTGLAGLGASFNPLIPATAISADQVFRDKDPNISTIATDSGKQNLLDAHSSYMTSPFVINSIIAGHSQPPTNDQPSTQQGVRR